MSSPASPANVGALWREPVEVVNEHGRSPIILVCEHASNYIPPEYGGLGLDTGALSRHIAWDIGAANLTRSLSKRLDAPAFLGTYSRLLIDLNRPLHAASGIPVSSEGTEIAGNLGLAHSERDRRTQRIFVPFHERIARHVDDRERAGRPCAIVGIHSFTPVYFGKARPWHAGVLFDRAVVFAESIIAGLRADSALNVEANVPYGVSPDEDYALLVHGDNRNHPAVLIEIRNDLMADSGAVEDWAHRLESAISAAWRASGNPLPDGDPVSSTCADHAPRP